MKGNQAICFVFLIVLITVLTSCTTQPIKETPTLPPSSTQTPVIMQVPVTLEVTREVPVEKQVLATVEVTRIVRVTATPIPTNTKAPEEMEEVIEKTTRLSGNYAFTTQVESQGCYLTVENTLSRVPPESVAPYPYRYISRIHFQLDCCNGAPSYHLGSASGDIIEMGNAAVYQREDPLFDEACKLIFIFSDDQVTVYQIGESWECGFGHAVYANGVYHRVKE